MWHNKTGIQRRCLRLKVVSTCTAAKDQGAREAPGAAKHAPGAFLAQGPCFGGTPMSSKMVRLNNGAVEDSVLVAGITLALQGLMEDDPILFYELVLACRDRSFIFFGDSGERLQRLGLLS